jgi:hypothetical protein
MGRDYIATHRWRECEGSERGFRKAGPLSWFCEGLTVDSLQFFERPRNGFLCEEKDRLEAQAAIPMFARTYITFYCNVHPFDVGSGPFVIG